MRAFYKVDKVMSIKDENKYSKEEVILKLEIIL